MGRIPEAAQGAVKPLAQGLFAKHEGALSFSLGEPDARVHFLRLGECAGPDCPGRNGFGRHQQVRGECIGLSFDTSAVIAVTWINQLGITKRTLHGLISARSMSFNEEVSQFMSHRGPAAMAGASRQSGHLLLQSQITL